MREPLYRLARFITAHVAVLGCVGVLLAFNETSRGQALVAQGAIDLRGNGLVTDSFDSSAPDYPGFWTVSIRKAEGDVITSGLLTNFNTGNISIAGHVRTGPGGSSSLGTNCSVGDLAWVDAGTQGVEPGWSSDDANVVLKDVEIPQTSWIIAPGPGNMRIYSYAGTNVTGTNLHTFSHVIVAPGNYTINDSGDIYVATNCAVNLFVLSSAGIFAPNMLYVAGTGTNAGRVTCYVDCTNCVVGTEDSPQGRVGQSIVLLGTSNCTSLKYKGNGDFTGVLYFPQADCQLSGGGSGIMDFVGCLVAKTVRLNGHYHFHFDEALYQLNLPMLLFGASPQNRSALVGQDLSLNGSAVGRNPLNYQWLFESNNIPDATNSSLSITNIQMADAGLYEVVATNISGSVTSQVQLAVYGSATPNLQSAAVSTNGVFQVSVAGVPSFNYALEVSSNLIDWVPISTNVSPYVFGDTNAMVLPQRFYRAVYVP